MGRGHETTSWTGRDEGGDREGRRVVEDRRRRLDGAAEHRGGVAEAGELDAAAAAAAGAKTSSVERLRQARRDPRAEHREVAARGPAAAG